MTEVLQQKILTEGKKFYDVWMHEVSDNIQAMALAYSERFCLEASMAKLQALSADSQLSTILTKAIRLYALLYLKENLGWYMMNGIVSQKAG